MTLNYNKILLNTNSGQEREYIQQAIYIIKVITVLFIHLNH